MKKTYNFVFDFDYFIPGGLSDIRRGTYQVPAFDVAMAVNEFNRYCLTTFHGAVTINITKIKKCKIKKPEMIFK
jgi:hypothetical protein